MNARCNCSFCLKSQRHVGIAEDLSLWRRACDGHPSAKTDLVTIVTQIVRSRLRRLRLQSADAEDIESNMQLSVQQLVRDYPNAPRSGLRTWLFYRVRAVTKEFFRQKQKLRRVTCSLEGDYPSPQQPPANTMEQAELRQALALCLDELPREQRTALWLRYGDGHR